MQTNAHYRLPTDYRPATQTVHYNAETAGPDHARFFQREVYLYARELLEANGWSRVVDVGCGDGRKLVEYLGAYETVGVETEPAISALRERYPNRRWLDSGVPDETFVAGDLDEADVVICADVIEHVRDPDELLRFIASISFRALVLSSPDRERLRLLPTFGERAWRGPPLNKSHYREWTQAELANYLASQGFPVATSFHAVMQPECQWHLVLSGTGNSVRIPTEWQLAPPDGSTNPG